MFFASLSFAQSPKFEIKKVEDSNGWDCSSNVIEYDDFLVNTSLSLFDVSEDNKGLLLEFNLLKVSKGENDIIVSQLEQIASKVSEKQKRIQIPIEIILEQGYVLKSNECYISYNSVFEAYNSNKDFGAILRFYVNAFDLVCNKDMGTVRTMENQKKICRYLRNCDIYGIKLGDTTFATLGLKSAEYYNSMLNALGSKTGKGEYYNDIKVSVGDFKCAVLSSGQILCRLIDFNIKGAKNTPVEIWMIFENKSSGVSDVIKAYLTPNSDNFSYNGYSFKGNVNDLKTLRDNRGNFKVYAIVFVNPHKVEGKYGTSYDTTFESNSKSMTIYYNGFWKSSGGGI